MGPDGVSLRNLIRRMSLTHRLLALTLVASLPGMIALIYNAIDQRNTRYNDVRADALRSTQAVVAELDQVFDGIQGALRAMAESEAVYEANSTVCTDYIMRVRPNIAAITAVLVVGLDGNIRCISEPSLASPNLAHRDYFRAAVDAQRFSIGPSPGAWSRIATSFRSRCRSCETARPRAPLSPGSISAGSAGSSPGTAWGAAAPPSSPTATA